MAMFLLHDKAEQLAAGARVQLQRIRTSGEAGRRQCKGVRHLSDHTAADETCVGELVELPFAFGGAAQLDLQGRAHTQGIGADAGLQARARQFDHAHFGEAGEAVAADHPQAVPIAAAERMGIQPGVTLAGAGTDRCALMDGEEVFAIFAALELVAADAVLVFDFPGERDGLGGHFGLKTEDFGRQDGAAGGQKDRPDVVVAAAAAVRESQWDGGRIVGDDRRDIAEGVRAADGLVGIVIAVARQGVVVVLETRHAAPYRGGVEVLPAVGTEGGAVDVDVFAVAARGRITAQDAEADRAAGQDGR